MARLVLHDGAEGHGASPPRHLSPSASSPLDSPMGLGSRSAPPGSAGGAVVTAADAPQLARELDASRRHLAEARAAKSALRRSLAEADASLAALSEAAADEAEAARRGRTSTKPSMAALEGAGESGESGGAAQLAVAAARQAVHRGEKCQAALRDELAALTRQLSETNAERATERQRAAQQLEALEVRPGRQLGARRALWKSRMRRVCSSHPSLRPSLGPSFCPCCKHPSHSCRHCAAARRVHRDERGGRGGGERAGEERGGGGGHAPAAARRAAGDRRPARRDHRAARG
jgi:hypothetical protein